MQFKNAVSTVSLELKRKVKNAVFWHVMPCSLVKITDDSRKRMPQSSGSKTEAAYSFETPVKLCQTAQFHSAEDSIRHGHRPEGYEVLF
jgi:hypothetical protein